VDTENEQHRTEGRRRWSLRLLVGVAVAGLLVGLAGPVGANNGRRATQETRVLEQDESGEIHNSKARLRRRENKIDVAWRMPTPESGTYDYPTADQVPPGAPPHPTVEPGTSEVFSLWAFVFNNPDLCSEECNFDDIGDTPAQGGIFQLDHTIGDGRTIKMAGKIYVSELAAAGVPLQNPHDAEVHVAMAPHGKALIGADLTRQFGGAIGGPDQWWPALFFADCTPSSGSGC